MNISSYHADGSILAVTPAIQREKAGSEYLPDHWHIWLKNGKRITSSAEKLDAYYSGWRTLPTKTILDMLRRR